jgi:AcrR family transcriptional regulator
MRARLLDATIESLAEKGYGGTTTLEVQQRAGVSRGALLHHFASRTELILAALEHLTRERLAALQEELTQHRPIRGDRVAWTVRVIWNSFDGPLFNASLELWLASRNDADLRAALVPQEKLLGGAIAAAAADLFGEVATHGRFAAVLEVLLDAMRGAAARAVLRSPASSERLIANWTALVKIELGV